MTNAKTTFENFTLGEVAAIESLSGQSIAAMATGAPVGKMMAAMAYVIKRRSNPDFTFDDALALNMAQANEVMGFNIADPTA